MADPIPQPPADPAEARRARRQRRRERTREDILAAARVVLLRDGIATMTLDAVAREAGMSKTGLYYYFASKEALVFELMFSIWEQQGARVRDAVAGIDTGPAALSTIIRNTVEGYAPRMDDFRLAFLLGQVSNSSRVEISAEQFARIRPLNDMVLEEAARKLTAEGPRGAVEPRLLAFLAYVSALGLLTMKGFVESHGDPLRYSDEQLVEALGKVFAAAAAG